MRTISVKEAAEALGITPRAVTYRLEKKQLKGFLRKNEYGSPEWRIYPTKELEQAFKGRSDEIYIDAESVVEPETFERIDAEEITYRDEDLQEKAAQKRSDWIAQERELTKTLVEEVIKPHLETIQRQAQALVEKDRIIEEKDRQIRLLPDLEKQAKEEQKRAEERAFEVEALKKQLEAVEKEKEEKGAESEKIQQQLEEMRGQLENLQTPWWKKWFMPVDVNEQS